MSKVILAIGGCLVSMSSFAWVGPNNPQQIQQPIITGPQFVQPYGEWVTVSSYEIPRIKIIDGRMMEVKETVTTYSKSGFSAPNQQ